MSGVIFYGYCARVVVAGGVGCADQMIPFQKHYFVSQAVNISM